MKRLIGSFIVLLAIVSIASVSFAAKDVTSPKETTVVSQEMCVVNVIGHIVSIEKAKNKIVVKDQADKQNKVITVKPEELSKLKVGDVVRFELSASPMAQSVEIMKLDKTQKGK
jgi:uncharacterized membrane protein YqgA involved in biofilm formation